MSTHEDCSAGLSHLTCVCQEQGSAAVSKSVGDPLEVFIDHTTVVWPWELPETPLKPCTSCRVKHLAFIPLKTPRTLRQILHTLVNTLCDRSWPVVLAHSSSKVQVKIRHHHPSSGEAAPAGLLQNLSPLSRWMIWPKSTHHPRRMLSYEPSCRQPNGIVVVSLNGLTASSGSKPTRAFKNPLTEQKVGVVNNGMNFILQLKWRLFNECLCQQMQLCGHKKPFTWRQSGSQWSNRHNSLCPHCGHLALHTKLVVRSRGSAVKEQALRYLSA